ncbi:MAG: DNA-3-methyladenine glycosylase I [Sulfobacillus thermosulfidooxidans]|nr:MAG: DNA-3-methyladenine glycosylase I [Sulfobacillus thermosulfidooxidans]
MAGCGWEGTDPLYRQYHDTEWGVPVLDDTRLFEFIVLESAQAGLSWLTILRKRSGYRQAFDYFDPKVVATWSAQDIVKRVANPAIIRNHAKITAAVTNAQAFLRIQQEWGSFARYLWHFAGNRPEIHHYTTRSEVPSTSSLSNRLAGDLKQRGFRFFGPTICYAFCQATGVVMDHLVTCDRYSALSTPPPRLFFSD